MLKVRLQRIGKTGQAHFRIVVQEHSSRVKGKFLELLGSYDPHSKDLVVEKERITHWISKGAQLSPTINNLFINKKIIEGEKVKSWRPRKNKKGAEVTATPPAATPAS